MDARTLFLNDHARIHRASMAPAEGLNLGDFAIRDLSDEAIRARPDGHESIAWFTWHMARCEDIAINTVLRRAEQVLDDAWCSRLGVPDRHMGTGMTDEETGDLSKTIDLGALHAYRDAVGLRTREFVSTLDFDTLDLPAETPSAAGTGAGAFGPNAPWVGPFWEGRSRGWFLSWLGVGHNYMHLAEMAHVATILGRPAR